MDNFDLRLLRFAVNSNLGGANYNPAFDADGDGHVNASDLLEFRLRLGQQLP